MGGNDQTINPIGELAIMMVKITSKEELGKQLFKDVESYKASPSPDNEKKMMASFKLFEMKRIMERPDGERKLRATIKTQEGNEY